MKGAGRETGERSEKEKPMTRRAADTGATDAARLALLAKRFAMAARAHHEALEAFDEGRTESQARMVAALREALARAGRPGEELLLGLVESSDPVVAGMAAVYSMRLDPGRCVEALRRVAMEPGLLGFRAEMALQRWEAGEWEE
jgi:hypothetical protein